MYKKYSLYTLALFIISLVVFGGITITHASVFDVSPATYTPLVLINGLTDPTTVGAGIGTYIQNLYRYIVSFSIILAVVMFTIHAFQYLISETTIASKAAARTGMMNSVIGLLIILCAYLILYTINPAVLNLNVVTDNSTLSPPPPATTATSCVTTGGTPPTANGVYLITDFPCTQPDGSTVMFNQYQPFSCGGITTGCLAICENANPGKCMEVNSSIRARIGINYQLSDTDGTPVGTMQSMFHYVGTFSDAASCNAAIAAGGSAILTEQSQCAFQVSNHTYANCTVLPSASSCTNI